MFYDLQAAMQHSTLVAMGVRWLSRQCSVVLYEFATAADENPDVIGWVPEAGSSSSNASCIVRIS